MNGLDPHQALRAATAAHHERLDALFSRFDLADAEDYGRFLAAHAAAALPLEAALDAAHFERLLPDWPGRRRSDALRSDLAALGLEASSLAAAPATGMAAAWGRAYVLEGSRLGGRVLARRLAPGLPRAYLAAEIHPKAWPNFLAALGAALTDPAALEAACSQACTTFELFEAAGRRQLKAEALAA